MIFYQCNFANDSAFSARKTMTNNPTKTPAKSCPPGFPVNSLYHNRTMRRPLRGREWAWRPFVRRSVWGNYPSTTLRVVPLLLRNTFGSPEQVWGGFIQTVLFGFALFFQIIGGEVFINHFAQRIVAHGGFGAAPGAQPTLLRRRLHPGINAVNRPRHDPADHWFEEFQRCGVVIGVECRLISFVAKSTQTRTPA